MRFRFLLLTLFGILPWGGCSAEDSSSVPGKTPAAGLEGPPNLVLVVLDDLRDSLQAYAPCLPHLRAFLDRPDVQDITLSGYTATTPLCCPSRAGILRGQYAHTTGIHTNTAPDGGETLFRSSGLDQSTIATWLQASGYHTALVGKYLNLYKGGAPVYRPPGWSRWFARTGGGNPYTKYAVANDQNDIVRYDVALHGDQDYSTDVYAREAVDVIQSAPPGSPLFLMFCPETPHLPAVPASRHLGAFAGLGVPHDPDYSTLPTDPPCYLAALPWSAQRALQLDALYQKQAESLLATDEAFQNIVDALEISGRLDSTVFLIVSDNGLQSGANREASKNFPHRRSTTIPAVVASKDASRVAFDTGLVNLVANIDIAPTLAELAGIAPPSWVEGVSFAGLLSDPLSPWNRAEIALTGWDHPDDGNFGTPECTMPSWVAVRTAAGEKLVEYFTGEKELYLAADPYERTNLANDPAYQALVASLSTRLHGILGY